MRKITTVREALNAAGGYRAAAAILHTNYAVVCAWAHKDRFPAKTYKFKEFLRTQGFTAPDSLWGLTEPRKAQP